MNDDNEPKPAASPSFAPSDAGPPSLRESAAGLDAELEKFEALTRVVVHTALESHENLDLAADALRQAADSHERFGEHLKALIHAVERARDRQHHSATALNARGEELRKRREELGDLRERFAKLGEQARQLNGLVQWAGPNEQPDRGEMLERVGAARTRIVKVIEGARELALLARAARALDLASEAESLEKQLESARRGLDELRDRLSQ